MTKLLADQMRVQFQKGETKQNIPEQFWNDLPKLLATEFSSHIDEFINKLVPLYAEEFTLEELKEINKFYDDPTGAKLRNFQLGMAQNTSPIAVQWAHEVTPKIMGKVFILMGTYLTKPVEE